MTEDKKDECPTCGKEFHKSECESHKESKDECYYCHLNKFAPEGHIVKEEEVPRP